MSGGAVNVVVCDDHRLFAEAISEFLRSCGHHVLCVTTEPDKAQAACMDADVDVCFMALKYSSGADGLAAIAAITSASPPTRVIALTLSQDDELLADALDVGAVAAIAKTASIETIIDVLRRVEDGEVVFPQSALRRLTERTAQSATGRGGALTPREIEVLELLCAGAATTAIAAELCISVATVRSHVQNVLTKLGVHSKLEAVTVSLAQGLTSRVSA